VELTSQSWFCNSCHIMNPYYESWKAGSHKDVACVKCHISPGADNFIAAKLNGAGQVVDDLLNRTSTKPSASVSNLACMRSGCHTQEKVLATKKTEGTYKFNHEKHVGLEFKGLKLECGSCHSHVKGDEHFAISTNVCITCHMLESAADELLTSANGAPPVRKGLLRMDVREATYAPAADAAADAAGDPGTVLAPPTTCKACHEPPSGILERRGMKVDHAQYLAYGASCDSCHRNATAAPDPMDDSRCLECHTFGVENALSAEEMHKIHSEGKHKIECLSCHGTIRHGTSAQTATFEQFDCRRCHQDQHMVQRQTYVAAGATGAAAHDTTTVSPMFMAHVDCTGCHVEQHALEVKPGSRATVAVATAASCDRCHKPGLGEQMIPLWQRTTRTLYDQVDTDLKALGTPSEKNAAAVAAEVQRLLDTIRLDGSWGVHNPKYTQHLLEQARDKLAALRKETQP
jgi:nitrate/TMAO reductase-like tetraheme cytochrome c subunit